MIKPHRLRGSSSIRTLAILVGVIATAYLARDILIPLAFAVTLTLVLTPAVSWLVQMHIKRVFAALIAVIILVVASAGIGFVIFNQLVQVLDGLPDYQENIHNKIQAMRAPAKGAIGRASQNIQDLRKELSNEQTPAAPAAPVPKDRQARRAAPADAAHPAQVQIVPAPVSEVQYLRDLARPFIAPLGMLGIVLIFTVFLLIEQDDLRDRLFRLAGLSRLNLMTQALDDATRRVSRYLMLQFLVNAAFGVLCGTGLYFIGVPYAVLWGTVAAILRIVPYVGSTIAGLLPLLLSLAVFDKWTPPLLVFCMFLVLEIVTANLLEPWLYGMHTGISSLALLLTTVFWAILWGPAGLILSTPLTVCLVVLGRHVPQFSFLHILLGDEPVLAAEAQLYQRLLAMDHHGAHTVLNQHPSQSSIAQLYDSVMIPALTMVERDRHKGALDPEREEFIFLSVREILGEFAERVHHLEDSDQAPSVPAVNGRFLCVPSDDECDEITAAMLAQLIEASGRISVSFPSDPRLQHTIRMMEPTESDVFCISALPPFAFGHARTLSLHLRRRYPKTRIMVGVWGFTGDTNLALKRFQPSQPDQVVTSLASAIAWLCPSESRDTGPVIEVEGRTLVS